VKLRWVMNSDTGERVLQYSDDNGETWFIVPMVYGESVTSADVRESDID
jgi:hypothetical protein